MNNICGYTGLYKEPISGEMNAIYMATGGDKNELNIIILTSGSYNEVFRFASSVSYPIINIFINSLDVLFISDIYRLVENLKHFKPSVNLIYPGKVNCETSDSFRFSINKTNLFQSSQNQSFIFEYLLSSQSLERELYDIVFMNGEKKILFTPYMTEEKINEIKDKYDEIHMAYNSTLYGGLTGIQVYEKDSIMKRKLKFHSFVSYIEIGYVKEHQCSNLPDNIYMEI